jgi:hypothetical protein
MTWYHGTPDVREVEACGKFIQRSESSLVVRDLDAWKTAQDKLRTLDYEKNNKEYHALIEKITSYQEYASWKKPVFLTNMRSVAKTYADDTRAFDYQNAVPKLLEVSVTDGALVSIHANGNKFSSLPYDAVRKGFEKSGIDKSAFDEALLMLRVQSDKGIYTDAVSRLAQHFGFDIVDVIGVLDSYQGGNVRSTVRMVFDVNKLIVENLSRQEPIIKI